MKCFQFLSGATKGENQARMPETVRSNSTTSSEREMRRSGSEFNSGDVTDTGSESMGRSRFLSFSQKPNNLRVFAFSELRNATKNFSRALLIGEGGFGCVYRGIVRSLEEPNLKIEIAVKQLNRKGLQGHKEWLTEVNVLGILVHPNLVKLVGYCAEDDDRGIQRLLVYEYMPNRSVEDHLSNRSRTTLSWPTRLRVALDAARGLKYLHEEMEFQLISKYRKIFPRWSLRLGILSRSDIDPFSVCMQIIFRDFKTSNILLDKDWNAKLSDFGLARQGPTEGLSHVSTAIVGTLGYAAPEYLQTGRLTAKSDVWSYGVVLYELITGRRPIDRNRPKGEQKLLEWVKPYISDAKRFRIIMDPKLQGEYSSKSVTKLVSIANKCLVRVAKARPKMSEVVELIQQLVENTEIGTPHAPLKTYSEEEKQGTEQTKSLKRAISDWKMGESVRVAWQAWKPKLVRTC